MANVLYDAYKQAVLENTEAVDWVTDDIRMALVAASVTDPVPDTMTNWGQLSSAAIGTPGALDSKAVTNPSAGVFMVDAADEVFSAVTGAMVIDLVIYKHNATPANALLLVNFDTDSGGAIDTTPNGGDITVSFHADGIWRW